MERIETTILRSLAYHDEYSRKVLPFIRVEYFTDYTEKVVFEEICKFIFKYNKLPNEEILRVEVDNRTDLNESTYKEVTDYISKLPGEELDFQWLTDTTEKWCRDKSIYLALMESISIVDGQDEKKNKDAIPSILSDALAVSFDSNVGHDYLQDYAERYSFYHQKEEKIPFDLDFFNKVTKGGLPNKTLNIALAGTGVGKSLFMCHVAASVLLQGKNVLYITCEMAEERIAERIDANLLNVNIQEIEKLPRSMFENKVTKISEKTQGSLIIKEYPTATAHSGHFKSLLNGLALKKSFRPDIIFIDYLNICASSRYRGNLSVNSYSYIKGYCRGASEDYFRWRQTSLSYLPRRPLVLVMVATDVDLTDTSESFGLPATADLMFALISTEELEQLGQIMVKQLKNRYNDPTTNKRFVVGIDRAKMRLYDCEQSAQNDILDSGQEEEYVHQEKSSGPKKSFEGFKF